MNVEHYSEPKAPETAIRQRLVQASCGFDFRLGLWRCPSCRAALALRFQMIQDGSVRFICRGGCELGSILSALGLTFEAVGPSGR